MLAYTLKLSLTVLFIFSQVITGSAAYTLKSSLTVQFIPSSFAGGAASTFKLLLTVLFILSKSLLAVLLILSTHHWQGCLCCQVIPDRASHAFRSSLVVPSGYYWQGNPHFQAIASSPNHDSEVTTGYLLHKSLLSKQATF